MFPALLKKHSLEEIFNPNSIAVIGASNDKNKIGGFIFSEILKSKIKAYPINVKWKIIQGQKAYPNLEEVKEKIDIVIIAIPNTYVLEIVEKSAKLGIKNIVIISAGFKEVGEEGKKKEEELKKLILKYKLNVIGPNCLGFINPKINLNCSFAKDIPIKGDIALISQSGAVIDAIIDWSFKHRVGFSKIVSLGNMAGVDELQMLKYLEQDKETKAMIFYMETLEKGEIFAKTLKEISKQKPVIIINPGKSKQAQKAIGSHTGSLAQDHKLIEVILKENNAIIAENIDELYNLIIALNKKNINKKKWVILTNAGGPGVISTDAINENNFELSNISEKTKSKLEKVLPKEASLKNPIDILGDATAKRYKDTIEILIQDEEIDNILVLLTPQMMTDSKEIAKEIILNSKKTNKIIISSFLGDKSLHNAFKYFDYNNFANFQTPTQALKAMKKLYEYNNFEYEEENIVSYELNLEEINLLKKEIKGKKGLIDYQTTKKILKTFEINLPDKIILNDITEVLEKEINSNKKYVLKVDGIIHKKDIGGVILNITKENFKEEALHMFDKLSLQNNDFYLTLEEQVQGVETIIGLKQQKDLGNFLMFGWGGTYVSLYNDINFTTCPLTYNKAKKIISESKIFPLLNGYRGGEIVKIDELIEIMVRLSYLQYYFEEIKEIDLNPVICNKDGIFLVDVKFIL